MPRSYQRIPFLIALFLSGCASGPSDKAAQPDQMKIDPITASQKCVFLIPPVTTTVLSVLQGIC